MPTNLALSLPQEVKDALDETSKASGVPRAVIINRLLVGYLSGAVFVDGLPAPAKDVVRAASEIKRKGRRIDRG